MSTALLQTVLLLIFFGIGLFSLGSGLTILLRHEFQNALRTLATQGSVSGRKALGDPSLGPAAQGLAQLLDSVNRLVQTAMGIGAFLSLLGFVICLVSLWMLGRL